MTHSFNTSAPNRLASALALALAVPLVLTACGGGGSSDTATPAPTGPQSITIDFAAKAGTQDVKCGTAITGLGNGNVSAQLHDLRFYVSNVALVNDKDESVSVALDVNDWQTKEVALIDLEDGTGACADAGTKAMNLQIKGTVPAGTYKGVKLTIGVPSKIGRASCWERV